MPLLITLVPFVGDVSHVETVQALSTRLTAEMGQPVVPDRVFAGRPIYVDRRSMAPLEVLRGVAYGLRASVVRTEKGLRITRTDADKRTMREEARLLWKEQLRDWLAECDRNKVAAAAFGNRQAQIDHYQAQLTDQLKRFNEQSDAAAVTLKVDPSEFTPAGALYQGIVRSIGIEKLASVGPNERRIWSNLPAANQLACPNGNALLETFERDRRAGSDGAANPAPPARFTFAQLGRLSFRLAVYDEAGNALARYGGPPFPLNMAGPIFVTYARLAHPFGKEPSAWRSLDPDATSLEPFVGRLAKRPSTPKAELPAPLREPDRSDPLDYTVRMGLEEAARLSPGKGFVVVPTDELLSVAEDCVAEGKMNVAGFAYILDKKCRFERKDLGGIAVLRAQDPYLAELRTVDRLRLALQVRNLLKRSTIGSLDVAAAFYGTYPTAYSHVARGVFEAVVRSQPHTRSSVLYMNDEELAWIGAAMSAHGSAQGQVTIDPKSEPFRSMIDQGVNSGWLRFESAQKLSDAQLDPVAIVESPQFRPRLVAELESVPVLSALGVGSENRPLLQNAMFQPIATVAGMYGSMIGGSAEVQFSGKKVDREGVIKALTGFGGYHLGAQDWLHVDLYPAADLRSRRSINETRLEKADVTFEALPESIRTRLIDLAFDAAVAQAKANPPPPAGVGGSED